MVGKIPIVRIALNNYVNKKEGQANAKLIASAPEMFEMLNNIYDKELHITQKDRNEIFKLIKKITE